MKNIILNEIEYELLKDYKEGFNREDVIEKCTDYFIEYDYIFGDYAYDKLRLKGFYNSDSKKKNNTNDIRDLENYIKNYCAYDARYFLLKKKLKKVEK